MIKKLFLYFVVVFLGVACRANAPQTNGKLKVVATTTIVGDVVKQVAGDLVELKLLMPASADPHAYQPTPQDLATVAEADLIFINGLGFEQFLQEMLENAGTTNPVISVSEGIEPLELTEAEHHKEAEEEHHHGTTDPHVWWNPQNVQQWSQNISQALTQADPIHADLYQANAQQYQQELETLDQWVAEQVSQIPPEQRVLVTDHDSLGYLADRYQFEIVGAIIPAYSTAAAPSAQELSALQTVIVEHGAKAIFVGNTANPQLAAQLAQDLGVQWVMIYTDSLSEADGPASSYLNLVRYTVKVIVAALK